MVKRSDGDLRALEQKIQAEIQRIFSEYRKDPGKQAPGPDKAPPATGKRRRSDRNRTIPAGKRSAIPGRKKLSGRKKAFDTNRLLHGATSAGDDQSPDIIGEDISKIFGRKYRRRSKRAGG